MALLPGSSSGTCDQALGAGLIVSIKPLSDIETRRCGGSVPRARSGGLLAKRCERPNSRVGKAQRQDVAAFRVVTGKSDVTAEITDQRGSGLFLPHSSVAVDYVLTSLNTQTALPAVRLHQVPGLSVRQPLLLTDSTADDPVSRAVHTADGLVTKPVSQAVSCHSVSLSVCLFLCITVCRVRLFRGWPLH